MINQCSYTGILGLYFSFNFFILNFNFWKLIDRLQKKEVDLYLKPEPNFLFDEPWLHYSMPFMSEPLMLTQTINDQKDMKYFDLITNFFFSTDIFISYLLISLTFLLLCIGFSRLTIVKEKVNILENHIWRN